MVLLDMMQKIEPTSRVFVLDTGRLHQATHDLIDRVRERYDMRVEVVFPNSADVQAMVAEHGPNLFYESLEMRKLCCRLRKVEPMRRYLTDVDAYISGLRRDQNVTRVDTPKVERDRQQNRVATPKVCVVTRDVALGLRRRRSWCCRELRRIGDDARS